MALCYSRLRIPRAPCGGLLQSFSSQRRTGIRGIVVLGIETSWDFQALSLSHTISRSLNISDDTSVAILQHDDAPTTTTTSPIPPRPQTTLLYHRTVTSDNRLHGGIHPLISLDSHRTHLAPLIEDALKSVSRSSDGKTTRPDLVVATRGPGMRSSLAVGLDTAKGLAVAWGVPFVGVNHMLGHALTHRLAASMEVKGASEGSQTGESLSSSKREEEEGGTSNHGNYYTLLVSGGHTILLKTPTSSILSGHIILAETIDLAVGDMLDKSARRILPGRLLSLAKTTAYARALEEFVFPKGREGEEVVGRGYDYYPPGTAERMRQDEELDRRYPDWSPIPVPFMGTAGKHNLMAYSFSGVGSTVDKVVEARAGGEGVVGVDEEGMCEEERRWLGRQVMQTTFEHLARRLVLAVKQSRKAEEAEQRRVWKEKYPPQAAATTTTTAPQPPFILSPTEPTLTLVIGGGVAANSFLRHVLKSYLESELSSNNYPDFKVELIAPPVKLCTDNAAMIAWAGLEMWNAGWRTELSVRPVRKWSLDPREKEVVSSGRMKGKKKAEEGYEDEKEARGVFGVEGWVRREGF